MRTQKEMLPVTASSELDYLQALRVHAVWQNPAGIGQLRGDTVASGTSFSWKISPECIHGVYMGPGIRSSNVSGQLLRDFSARPSCNGTDGNGAGFTFACYWFFGNHTLKYSKECIKSSSPDQSKENYRMKKMSKVLSFQSYQCQGCFGWLFLSLNRRSLKSS